MRLAFPFLVDVNGPFLVIFPPLSLPVFPFWFVWELSGSGFLLLYVDVLTGFMRMSGRTVVPMVMTSTRSSVRWLWSIMMLPRKPDAGAFPRLMMHSLYQSITLEGVLRMKSESVWIGVGEYCNGTRSMHNELVVLFSVIDSNTHIHSFLLLCVCYHSWPWRSQLVWQLFSLTCASAHTLIMVVIDLIHSMWVCDAVCQSFFNASIIGKWIWMGHGHHCDWICVYCCWFGLWMLHIY